MFNLKKIFGFSGASGEVRVRIAPSPTGLLHIGTARTALFNWLFAKHYGGKFILRIEDTDLERSKKEFETNIIEGLQWLGLEWDEGVFRQSDRLDTYEKYLKQLLAKGDAYYCDCSKEELETERQIQMKRGEAPKYSGKCRNRNVAPERAQLIRFKIPVETVSFKDLIRGDISFDAALFGDLAVAKNLRTPLYNFAVVIDDQEMQISHVIRGEDHIANTPKQILLQRALGFRTPIYAHLPLILDPDRSKMSKRHSATSIEEYRQAGYLPDALVNFIALLGWHAQGDQEIFTREALINQFSIERVQKAGAVFNIEKLDWLNAQYIKQSGKEELKQSLKDIFGGQILNYPFIDRLIDLSRDRIAKLSEFKAINDFFFDLPDYNAELLIWKTVPKEKIQENLRVIQEMLKAALIKEFNQKDLEAYLMPFADTVGRGEALWPLRVALSGKDKSPGPFEIMDVLGKEETLRRINIALGKLE